jgi:hypothetical protein
MDQCRQIARLRPVDCSAAVNVATGMLAGQLECSVDAAFSLGSYRSRQAKIPQDWNVCHG